MRAFLIATLVVGGVVACSATNSDDGQTASGPTSTTGGGTGGDATTSAGSESTTSTGGSGGTGGSTTSAGGKGGTSGAGGSGGQGGKGDPNACTWNSMSNPCSKGFYCKAVGCGQGTCTAVSTTNDAIKQPVCGCDSVNYWNANTAAVYGVSVLANAECVGTSKCAGANKVICPSEDAQNSYAYAGKHYCGKQIKTANDCTIMNLQGKCWGMPDKCDQIGFGGQLSGCAAQQKCDYECDTIKGEYLYYQDQCPM